MLIQKGWFEEVLYWEIKTFIRREKWYFQENDISLENIYMKKKEVKNQLMYLWKWNHIVRITFSIGKKDCLWELQSKLVASASLLDKEFIG